MGAKEESSDKDAKGNTRKTSKGKAKSKPSTEKKAKKATKKKDSKAAEQKTEIEEKVEEVSAALKAPKTRVYQPHELYEVGELIKHPLWNEEGTIKEIEETPDGLQSIIVDFSESGSKRLVIDYSLKI